MQNYTKEDIVRMVKEEDVEFIRLQFTDILGSFKNIAITANQLEKALNNRFMFDGSSVEGFVRVEESDMILSPDLNTFEIMPWRPQQGKVARLICNVLTTDGKNFEGDPRYCLIRAIEEAKKMGYEFEVGPECEFFLFHMDDYSMPTAVTHEQGGYFDVGPVDMGENIRRDIVLNLEDDEAIRVQDALKLTDTEIANITRFERGNGLISTNSNHITVEFKASALEKQLITTDRYELSQIVQNQS